jgi:hypothetical protein
MGGPQEPEKLTHKWDRALKRYLPSSLARPQYTEPVFDD